MHPATSFQVHALRARGAVEPNAGMLGGGGRRGRKGEGGREEEGGEGERGREGRRGGGQGRI